MVSMLKALRVSCAGFLALSGFAQGAPQMTPLTAPQLCQRLEFNITNVPSGFNPFDPDSIRLDATFTLPSGGTRAVPAFWYQDYQRSLSGGYESDAPLGSAGWRLRLMPPEAGVYSVTLTVRTNGQPAGDPVQTSFTVATSAPPARFGYVAIAPGNQYFQTGDGQPLRLIGENVCWPTGRGTYDYDTWFAAMQSAGENFARIWMCPWAFGIEVTAGSLTNYSLQPAWRLDYVLQRAEERGIYLLLCLDYHGMFASQPDSWGGNNIWPQNPYNVTNGGPCAIANDFFTNAVARTLYQKRLRYLVARYGYSQNLLAWEFFNEIDNDYAYLNATDVAAWHGAMGTWLHTNDPFNHLVTTSLTGSSERPEMWTLPELDFAAYHSYGEAAPALQLAAVARSFRERYGKPVMIGEFGTDGRGWNRTNDPYLRGFRQGIWGGALGGSVGTAMSWWWENIDAEDDYGVYSALGSILNRTGWGQGVWTNIGFQTAGDPPLTVGNPIPGAPPIDVLLPLDGVWGDMTSGQLAVTGSDAAVYSARRLNAFVHGTWHADLKTPFRLNAWLTNNARIVLHLNSVAQGAILIVRVDGNELFATNLPNLDGTYNVIEEYNLDIPVDLPSGNRFIEVTNAGTDWFFLDWVRLEQVLPAEYAGGWQPSPDAIGVRGPRESLVYVVAPGVSFPGNATTANPPVQHATSITLTNWPDGPAIAEWYDPATAAPVGVTQTLATNGDLVLIPPDFAEDLAVIVYPPPRLTPIRDFGFQFRLDSETGGRYLIQKSADLVSWTSFLTVTNTSGSTVISDASGGGLRSFFRARRAN